mgnify:CR=1 FL=1
MSHSTPRQSSKRSEVNPPRKCVEFLLQYSRSLEVMKLRNGMEVNVIKN